MSNTAAEDFVDSTLKKHPVVMFSKSYCPYCTRAKQMLASLRPPVDVTVIELDRIEGGDRVQKALIDKYHVR